MFFRIKNESPSGFTLIELLVSIAIFGLLSSFIVASYRGNEKSLQLKIQAQNIVASLETAQNLALSGEMIGDALPLSYEFDISSCQGGCSYQTFALLNGDKKIVSRGSVNAIIAVPAGNLSAVFTLPRGQMTITDNNGVKDVSTIQISNDSGSYCITLNSVSGRISSVSGSCNL